MAVPKAIINYIKNVVGTPDGAEISRILGGSSTSSGPSRPSAGRSPPYYFKRIDAVDPTNKTGYGLIGDFVPERLLSSVPTGSFMMFKYNGDDYTPRYIVLQADPTSDTVITFKNGTTKTIPGMCQVFAACESFEEVNDMLLCVKAIPHGTAPKPLTRSK